MCVKVIWIVAGKGRRMDIPNRSGNRYNRKRTPVSTFFGRPVSPGGETNPKPDQPKRPANREAIWGNREEIAGDERTRCPLVTIFLKGVPPHAALRYERADFGQFPLRSAESGVL